MFMIRIIDSTLAMLDDFDLLPEHIWKFCGLMKEIGITDLEISEKVYETAGRLPEDIRFYMIPDAFEERGEYPGIYKFVCPRGESIDKDICQLQINDIREIIQLKAYKNFAHIRIVGLDDLLCHNYNSVMKNMNGYTNQAIINFCPEDSFHCAVALAVQWILNGNNEITTSFTGIGNRAATEEVMLALRVAARYKINQDFSALYQLKLLFEEMTNQKISNNKAIIGSALFDFEAGIHVDGIIKNPSNYVPFLPELVGQKFHFKVGKHSGRNSMKYIMDDLGVEVEDEKSLKLILTKVKQTSIENKRGLNKEEFISIVKEVLAYENKETDC